MSDKTLWVKLDRGHSDAAVTKVVVTGTVAEYPTTFDGGNELAVYFHWHFVLNLREFPDQSVVLDMTPGGSDGNTGILMASSQKILRPACLDGCLLTRGFTIRDSSQITVQGLINKLTSEGLTRYRYNDQGMGCRWWCEVVMRKLEDDGYVEEGTVTGLDQWWSNADDPRVPSAKIKGSFY